MYYVIYKTTNTVNGKYYIGKHQTKNLDDGYLGSGRGIVEAVKKYGKSSFDKEILFVFNSEEEMNTKEKEILTEDFIASGLNYNAAVGGEGGPHFKGKKHSAATKEKLRVANTGWSPTLEQRQKLSKNNAWKNKKLPDSLKQKISETRKKQCELRPMSQEQKDKISKSVKKRFEERSVRSGAS